MDDLKKKVYLDIFAAPTVLVPAVGGLSCLLGAWAMDGPAGLAMAGIAGLLAGVGIFATRIIYGIEGMTKRAWEAQQEKERKEHESSLDELERKLDADGDSRTTEIIRNLRVLYGRFKDGAKAGKFNASTATLIADKIESLYQACIREVEHSYELFKTAQELTGRPRQAILREREKVIAEVSTAVDQLGSTIEQCYSISSAVEEVQSMSKELEQSLEVARNVQQRLNGLTKTAGEEWMEKEGARK